MPRGIVGVCNEVLRWEAGVRNQDVIQLRRHPCQNVTCVDLQVMTRYWSGKGTKFGEKRHSRNWVPRHQSCDISRQETVISGLTWHWILMHSKGKPTAASAKIATAPADTWRKKSALLGSSELIAPSKCTALDASTQISIRMHDTVYCCLKGDTALLGETTWKDGWQKRLLRLTIQREKHMFITKQLTSFVLAAYWAWYVKTGFD